MNIKIPHIVQALCSEPLMILSNHLEPFIASCVFSDTKFVDNLTETAETHQGGGMIQVINVKSVTTNNSDIERGIFGYRDIANAINLGNADPKISAHVLYIKSPGGSVTGLAEVADIIHASEKPVYAYIDELGASAAYYLAAAATEIWTTPRSSLIGNIGSVVRTIDLTGILEKFGAKSIEVFGTDAVNKDLGFNDAKNGNPEKLRSLLVDPANNMFTSDLARYRPSLSKDFMDGAVHYSEAALQNGLVDHLGTFPDMLNAIATKLNNQQSIPPLGARGLPNQTNTMSVTKTVTMEVPETLSGAAKMFGAKIVDTPADANASAQATDTDTISAAAQATIDSLTQSKTDLQNSLNLANAKIDELTTAKNTAEASLVEANARITALSAENPAAARSEARQDASDAPAATQDDEIKLTMSDEFITIN